MELNQITVPQVAILFVWTGVEYKIQELMQRIRWVNLIDALQHVSSCNRGHQLEGRESLIFGQQGTNGIHSRLREFMDRAPSRRLT